MEFIEKRRYIQTRDIEKLLKSWKDDIRLDIEEGNRERANELQIRFNELKNLINLKSIEYVKI